MTDPKPLPGWRRIHDGKYTNGVFTVKKCLTQNGDTTFTWKFFLVHATPEEPIINVHDTLEAALDAASVAKPRFGR